MSLRERLSYGDEHTAYSFGVDSYTRGYGRPCDKATSQTSHFLSLITFLAYKLGHEVEIGCISSYFSNFVWESFGLIKLVT